MKCERILILTERFAPEEFLVNDLASAWNGSMSDLHEQDANHRSATTQIEVLTQVPSYPFDKIFNGFDNKLFQTTRELNDIKVHRVRTVLGYNHSVKRKILNYLNFAFLSVLWSIFNAWKYDKVFICHTGPLTMATASLVFHYLWRKPCTIWTQDMWPEAVYAYGFKRTKFNEKMLLAFVRLIYSACSRVLVSCPGFVDTLSARIHKPVEFVPQWDIGGRELAPKAPGGKSIFMFTGNHGVPQILDRVIMGFAAAGLDRAELHLVGGGVMLESLKELVREKGIKNVVFFGRQPHDKMEEFLSTADVLLLPLSEKFSLTLPGKFPAYLKAGRAIMGVISGEAARCIESEKLGLVAPPGDVDAIADTFREFGNILETNRARIDEYAKNCQSLSRRKFDRSRGIKILRTMACAFAMVLSVLAADPYVGYIYPAGMQRGTTNRLIVGGQFIRNIKGITAGKGIHVHDIEVVPNFPPPTGKQRKYICKWLDRVAAGKLEAPPLPENEEHFDEWRTNKWYSTIGDLDSLKRSILEYWLYTPRNSLQMSPAVSQKLLLTLSVDADAETGVRDFRVFNLQGVSPPRPFLISDVPHTVEPLYVPPHRKQPASPVITGLPCVLDGQIFPGSRDCWIFPMKRGATITFRVTAREFQPYIGDAVPGFFNPVIRILDKTGHECAFADDYFYHPDPVLSFTAPADGEYTLEIHDNLFRGRDDFTYEVDVREGEWKADARNLSLFRTPAYDIPEDSIIKEFSGVIKKPAQGNTHSFKVEEPTELHYDLLARRAGSPLDARVTLLKGAKELLTAGDVTNSVQLGSIIQSECDPIGSVRLTEPGTYKFKVEDETDGAGDDFFYNLRLHRPSERFEVWCTKSGLSVREGENWHRLKFIVLRHDGFDGTVTLEENDYFKFYPNQIPASSNVIVSAVIPKFSYPLNVTNFTLKASGVIRGIHEEVEIIPANEYNQAFAWDHLIPAREFVFIGFPRQRKKNQAGGKK